MRRPLAAVHAGDGDADVGPVAAHLDVAALDDADLARADGHAFAAGDGIGVVGIVRADHGVELRPGSRFLHLDVNLGVGQGLTHLVAHRIFHTQRQARTVDGFVQLRLHEHALRRGAEITQRGAHAVTGRKEPHHALHQVAARAGNVFGIFLAGAQRGHFGGQVVQREALLQLRLQVVVVFHIGGQRQLQSFQQELRFLGWFFG